MGWALLSSSRSDQFGFSPLLISSRAYTFLKSVTNVVITNPASKRPTIVFCFAEDPAVVLPKKKPFENLFVNGVATGLPMDPEGIAALETALLIVRPAGRTNEKRAGASHKPPPPAPCPNPTPPTRP